MLFRSHRRGTGIPILLHLRICKTKYEIGSVQAKIGILQINHPRGQNHTQHRAGLGSSTSQPRPPTTAAALARRAAALAAHAAAGPAPAAAGPAPVARVPRGRTDGEREEGRRREGAGGGQGRGGNGGGRAGARSYLAAPARLRSPARGQSEKLVLLLVLFFGKEMERATGQFRGNTEV